MAITNSDGSIVLSTKVDDSGLNKGLTGLKRGISAFGKAFAVAGAAGAAAFAGITKAAVTAYADYEQLVGGVETLFKDSADIVKGYADMAYQTAGLSANEYMNTVTSFSASLLQSLGGDTQKSAEYANQAIIDMSDNANKMGTSMEMIQNAYQGFAKQNYTMLDNLKLGYGGTKEEMQRLLDDASKLSGIEFDISSFADITEAIHVVQTEMGITGTTAKEASTTIQGSISSMKSAWENLLTGVVDSNEDLSKLMDNFSESIVTVFDNIAPAIKKVLKNLPKVVSTLGKEIIEMIPDIFGGMIPELIDGALMLVNTIAKTISKNAKKIGNGFVEILKIISKSIIDLVPTMIKAGKDIVLGIASGISGSMPVLSTAVTSIATVFAALKVANLTMNIVKGFQAINAVLNAYRAAVAASQSVTVLLAMTMTPLQLAVGVLTGQVSLATAAQVAWNAVMNMNPVMLMVGALALLAGAVAGAIFAYDSYLEKNSEIVIATQKIADASREAAEKTKELDDSMTQMTGNAEANILNLEAEAYANEMLATELFELASQAQLTADEKERMEYIVETLNGSISDLNLELDEETGKLNLTEEAVKNVISQKLELAKANAIQELYTEALKEQYKAEADAIENTKNLAEAQEILNGYMKDANSFAAAYYGTSSAEGRKAMMNAKEAVENYSKALQESNDIVQKNYGKIEYISQATGVALPESFGAAKESSKGFFDALIQQTSAAAEEVDQKGRDFGDGYVAGINEKQRDAYNAGYNLGLQAMQGTADAQRSSSPSKEAAKLGGFFGDGYAIGIKNKAIVVVKSAKMLAEKALKQLAISTDTAKKIISRATKSLITDSRSEVQKVLDEMNEELLESEKLYEKESERLKDSKSKADKAYLEELKKNAEKERKIHDARQKDVENLKKNIVNAYSDMADEALKSIDSLLSQQEKLAERLSDFGSVMEDVVEIEDKFSNKHSLLEKKFGTYFFTDLESQTRELEHYSEIMSKLRDREGMSTELFDVIKNMNYEESFAFAKKLIQLNDKQFNSYIEKWQKKQETTKKLSEELFGGGDTPAKRVLSDLTAQTQQLKEYYTALDAVKQRGGVPQKFFADLRDMGVEEGLEYANALLELSDEGFKKYIKEWRDKQELSKSISKELYADEADELADEIRDKFVDVENEFFSIGENAEAEFESGFMEQLKITIGKIRRTISGAFGAVQPMSGGYSINVPALARGSVLPGGKPFLAIVNDQPKGQTNVEAPLQTIVDAMNISLRNNGVANVVKEEHYYLDETELMTILHKLVKGGERLQGSSLLTGGVR